MKEWMKYTIAGFGILFLFGFFLITTNKKYIEIKSHVTGDNFYIDNNFNKLWIDDFMNRLKGHEKEVNSLLMELVDKLPNGTCVIDAGTHVGDTIIPLSSKCSKKNINLYGIDPDKTKIEFVDKMTELNNLKNIKTIIGGLSDKNGKGDLIKKQHPGAWKIKEGNEFNIYTIDELFSDKKVSLIHLDVEGYEYKTLLGGLKTIKKHKPYLIIEIVHGEDKNKIIPLLENLNYSKTNIDNNNYLFEYK